MTSVKNLSAIFQKIIEGAAPSKFTISHLKGLGFSSSNDVGVLALLKDLGFLTAEGVPTARYHAYRDRTQSAGVLAEAIRDAYGDLFLINEQLSEKDKTAVEGKFKQVHGVTDRVAAEQGRTFFALLKLADMSAAVKQVQVDGAKDVSLPPVPIPPVTSPLPLQEPPARVALGGLRYNIEIHLPATKDIEVFNAIFKSLKEHLIEH
ncbi:DUF5343 domain-containing protein [Collimonas humicola]|uniref:DUF5343 domain-containing protein n=1 Tax=Collimonas humicola TaxID=2825886 RepID=UPI001B8D7B46|nr:DUF5343 domain-containing protein [Collimonas humicola]